MKSLKMRLLEAKVIMLDIQIYAIDTSSGIPKEQRHKIGFSKEPITERERILVRERLGT